MKAKTVQLLCLLAGATNAATGSSDEFRLDLRGLGPWERRVARPTETIAYSTAWATNLTAAQQADAKAVVKVYPCLKEKPTYIAIDLSGGTKAAHYPIECFNEIPGGSWSDEYKTSKLVLRHIPAGSFIMGGRNTDYPGAVNTNLHMVTITHDFYMGVFEVTQRQWELVMGNRPSVCSNKLDYAVRPVENVSYEDMRGAGVGAYWPQSSQVDPHSFMGVLRSRTGMTGFDLPTSAQWEYACRAGTSTALNSGKNISVVGKSCPELNEVARNIYNSGAVGKSYNEARDKLSNARTNLATAAVGSYSPNAWGLYDMHGNVYERALDFVGSVSGGVDPTGDLAGDQRVNCGTGWLLRDNRIEDYACCHRGMNIPSSRICSDGFRLCLQGGEVCAFDGLTLIDATANGSANWMPAAAGTYYLAHEVWTNGVSAGAICSAVFDVPGPTLRFTPDGELTNGVGIVIGGATDGWQIYYTTDGSKPTTNATPYTGVFPLMESGTVRAIAVGVHGVTGDEARATYTLHDGLGLVGAVATPRYPWNGKVDVDVTLRGDPSLEYPASLEALDLLGGTNLPVRTVVCTRPTPQAAASDVQRSTFNLHPGTYRLTWDAAADIAGDFDFNRVAVTVKATGSRLLAYPKTLELTVAGYTGTETLTNVPTLVRLSTAIEGLSYADFATTNGADLAFFDANERPLPYEIDEWNTNGESLVWVKLPVLANGTRFTAAWGNTERVKGEHRKHEVWRDYAGVWHMNEDAGTAFDSTEHHLDGIPSCGTNKLADDMSQMVAYGNGACGRARVNATEVVRGGNYLLIPSYDALGLDAHFTISLWLRVDTAGLDTRIISRKTSPDEDSGWDVFVYRDSMQACGLRGASGYLSDEDDYVAFNMPPLSNWNFITCVFDGNRVQVFGNGSLLVSQAVVPVTDNGKCLALGGMKDAPLRTLCGQYDEIRLRGGSLSADRIKADYDMIANQNFLHYGTVR